MNEISLLRILAIMTCSLVSLASNLEAQEARTGEGAWAAAYAWLRANNQIPDTARVARDSADMWKRFVVCGGPADRPCTLTDNRDVTMVTVRRATPDTALIGVAQYFLRTARCPGSEPLIPTRIGTTTWWIYTFVYTNGKWEQRSRSGSAC